MENNNELIPIMSKIKDEDLKAHEERLQKGELFTPVKATPKVCFIKK